MLPYFECASGVIYCGEALELIPHVGHFDLAIVDPNYKKSNEYFSDLKLAAFDHDICTTIYDNMTLPNMYFWCSISQIASYISLFVTSSKKCSFDILLEQNRRNEAFCVNKLVADYKYCVYIRKRGYCAPSNYKDAKTVFNQNKDAPLGMVNNMVKNSTKIDQTVLTCFLANNNTLLACVDNNRKFIGIDKDERVCESKAKELLNKEKVTKLNFF